MSDKRLRAGRDSQDWPGDFCQSAGPVGYGERGERTRSVVCGPRGEEALAAALICWLRAPFSTGWRRNVVTIL